MKKLICLFILLSFISTSAWAEVLLIARSLKEYDSQTKTYKGTDKYAHSFIVLIPNNPYSAKMIKHKNLLINFGSGKKGFIIAGYPRKENKEGNRIDGELVALYNPPNDINATKDFFAGKNKEVWQFVWDKVESDLDDDTFIDLLKENTDNYIRNSHTDYDAVGSVIEEMFFTRENIAKNCNAFAFSLLTYSQAKKIPDLCKYRNIPGCRKLLNKDYFLMFQNRPYLTIPTKDLPAIQNDNEYRQRVKEKLNPFGAPFYEIMKRRNQKRK
ncbi:MAG: hypothetical protein IKP23_00785 [Elusimicrobiaceae bacterium]|nr:hypothetical protein [Elusimicrobiaceae bacterium]